MFFFNAAIMIDVDKCVYIYTHILCISYIYISVTIYIYIYIFIGTNKYTQVKSKMLLLSTVIQGRFG